VTGRTRRPPARERASRLRCGAGGQRRSRPLTTPAGHQSWATPESAPGLRTSREGRWSTSRLVHRPGICHLRDAIWRGISEVEAPNLLRLWGQWSLEMRSQRGRPVSPGCDDITIEVRMTSRRSVGSFGGVCWLAVPRWGRTRRRSLLRGSFSSMGLDYRPPRGRHRAAPAFLPSWSAPPPPAAGGASG